MHILFFQLYTDKPNPVYQEIACGLRRRGHEVCVGTLNRDGNLECRDGSRVVGVPGPDVRSSATDNPLSESVDCVNAGNS